jgi:hypothetical protein
MPKPQWTTKPQSDWLTARLGDFVAAQGTKSKSTMTHFFGPVYADWFKAFPSPDPTPEQLEKAKGDMDVAKATITKDTKSVSVDRCIYPTAALLK